SFPSRIEHPAAAHRREEKWKREVGADHRRAQVNARARHRVARPKDHVVENPRVFSQRDLVVGAAVDVIKDRSGQPALSQPPQVGDVEQLSRQNAVTCSTLLTLVTMRSPAGVRAIPCGKYSDPGSGPGAAPREVKLPTMVVTAPNAPDGVTFRMV